MAVWNYYDTTWYSIGVIFAGLLALFVIHKTAEIRMLAEQQVARETEKLVERSENTEPDVRYTLRIEKPLHINKDGDFELVVDLISLRNGHLPRPIARLNEEDVNILRTSPKPEEMYREYRIDSKPGERKRGLILFMLPKVSGYTMSQLRNVEAISNRFQDLSRYSHGLDLFYSIYRYSNDLRSRHDFVALPNGQQYQEFKEFESELFTQNVQGNGGRHGSANSVNVNSEVSFVL